MKFRSNEFLSDTEKLEWSRANRYSYFEHGDARIDFFPNSYEEGSGYWQIQIERDAYRVPNYGRGYDVSVRLSAEVNLETEWVHYYDYSQGKERRRMETTAEIMVRIGNAWIDMGTETFTAGPKATLRQIAERLGHSSFSYRLLWTMKEELIADGVSEYELEDVLPFGSGDLARALELTRKFDVGEREPELA